VIRSVPIYKYDDRSQYEQALTIVILFTFAYLRYLGWGFEREYHLRISNLYALDCLGYVYINLETLF